MAMAATLTLPARTKSSSRFASQRPARSPAPGSIAPTLVPSREGFFTSYQREGRFVTYYGDNHPKYAGNVVRAMASAPRNWLNSTPG